MQKKIILLCFLLVSSLMGISQTVLSPNVIAASGGVSRFSEIELEWTLGEAMAGTTGNSGRIYTIGFHQPLLISRPVAITEKEEAVEVKVFPNPVENMLKIQFLQTATENRKFLLTDLMGNTVLEKTISGKLFTAEIFVGHLTSGMYQLRIMTASGKSTGAFKIIKLH